MALVKGNHYVNFINGDGFKLGAGDGMVKALGVACLKFENLSNSESNFLHWSHCSNLCQIIAEVL